MRRRRSQPVDVPEFPEDVEWLNVDRPLSLRGLRGKVVLVNFWTSCCINCMHVIPELNALMCDYAPEFVAIGVHAAKCSAERDRERLRAAIQRHEITYPVLNDRDMRVWDAWQINAWPTSILIGPDGRLIARRTGESVGATLEESIRAEIQSVTRSGRADRTAISCRDERASMRDRRLSFPAGILADDRAERLFISDTNNNRVVAADFDGEVIEVVGTGRGGFEDGAFDEARLHHPLGLALDGHVLYVADRHNHAIRAVDFEQQTVRTIAGVGHVAFAPIEPGNAMKRALNSPWDLEIVHHRLYVTMAGAHQIWRLDLRSGEIEPYAGAGSPGLVDGSRGHAMLAQPSGLASDGVRLFFTDAGSSSIRWVYLPPGSQLGTRVGQGLFEYGDRDGPARRALLQFPLGLEHHAGDLYVADTYNNKIKRLTSRISEIETMLGTGTAGCEDGHAATFNEPRDLSCAGGRLWIADTNNHAIRVAPIEGGPVSTLHLHPLGRLD
ncbi:MAG: thioredoxin-like domain-containing protein [Armatimonadota bacterium]